MKISTGTPDGPSDGCPACGKWEYSEPDPDTGAFRCSHCGHRWHDSPSSVTRVALDSRSQQFAFSDLEYWAEQMATPQLLLDFENISFLSSEAICKLLDFQDRLKAQGGKVVIFNCNPNVREVFELMKIDRRIEICDDEFSGRQSFRTSDA